MKTIYLDSDFCCHLENDGTRISVETDTFDGKCRTYIEGFRFVPEGETWIRSDGVQFTGIMVSPAVNFEGLAKVQAQYEEDLAQMADMQNALEILGVTE